MKVHLLWLVFQWAAHSGQSQAKQIEINPTTFGSPKNCSVGSFSNQVFVSASGEALPAPGEAAVVSVNVSLEEVEATQTWLARMDEDFNPDTAHADYLFMAKEFQRQYHNSHGTNHNDYMPESAADPKQMHFLNGRLWCFFDDGPKAVRSLQESLKIDPSQIFSYMLLSKIWVGQGKWALAQDVLQEALRLQPENWQAQMALLYVMGRLGRHKSEEMKLLQEQVCARLQLSSHQARTLMLDEKYCTPSEELDRLWMKSYSKKSAAFLAKRRYVVLKNVLPPEIVDLMQGWYSFLLEHSSTMAHFQAKSQRHEYLPEAVSTYLNYQLCGLVSKLTGEDVVPTYPFPITYVPGGSIHPHVDVNDNAISLSFQVKIQPEKTSWPIYFLDPTGQDLSKLDASTASELVMGNNDGVLYYGPELVHWRVPQQTTLTQVVFAWRGVNESSCNNQ